MARVVSFEMSSQDLEKAASYLVDPVGIGRNKKIMAYYNIN